MPHPPSPSRPRFAPLLSAFVAFLYLVPTVIACGWAVIHRSPRTAAAVILAALVVGGATAAIVRQWRPFFLVQFPLYLLGLPFLAYTVLYGMPPGQTLANLLIGASLEEFRGFVLLPQARALLLLVSVWTVTYLGGACLIRPTAIFDGVLPIVRRGFLALLLLLAAATASDPAQLIDGIALQPMVGSVMFLAGDLPRAHDQLTAATVHKIPYGGTRRGAEEVHILVIGEAARRDSWSAYGYGRPTTPLLAALGDDIVWLRNATADANLTEWAVPILLTGIRPDKILGVPLTGNIVDLAKEAHFRTAWLVNQDITISTLVGVHADTLHFPPDFNSNLNGRHALDETLLPALREELARSGASRFIGIHMMGSHWEYYNRYPVRFQRYGAAQDLEKLSMISVFAADKAGEAALLDTYDNSVLYTDWFLRQVIDSASRLGVPASVTFFPDHGEDLQMLDHESGHGGPQFTPHQFSIPAFVWFNQRYRLAHPTEVDAVENNSVARIRSYDLFASLGQLMGIAWPGYDATRSFASPAFTSDTTTGVLAGGALLAPPDTFGVTTVR